MRNTWDLYQDSQLSDKVALQRISEATVKARRLFDESYVSAVSRISSVCDSQSKFSIVLTSCLSTVAVQLQWNSLTPYSRPFWGGSYGSDSSCPKNDITLPRSG